MIRKNSGMSLVEVLIGLSIGAMMFTAIALAVQVGARSTVANQDFFAATQSGRLGMSYMLRTIRQSDPEKPDPALGSPEDADQELTDIGVACGDKSQAFRFEWDPQTRHLNLYKDAMVNPVVLARNVSAFSCRRQSQQDSSGVWYWNNYQINMTVTAGDQSIRFSESVVPRRAILR